MTDDPRGGNAYRLSRRSVISAALAAAGGAQAFGQVAAAPKPAHATTDSPAGKRYDMKKSINLWAFPYPDKMSLEQCLQLAHDAGFDAIELNYDLDNDLSPKSGTKEFTAIRKMAERIGIQISGVCSFLFWPYPMTSHDPAIRTRSLELAGKMVTAAHDLGTENLLVVPGAVTIPWRTDYDPVPNDVCEERAIEAVRKLVPHAEQQKVNLNIENIFFNGFLMTPDEMNSFVDCFESERVRVHFDTGNIMLFQYPEHWIPILGARIQNVHLKEFTKKGTDYSLESFRPLLDGTTNWPAVMDEFQTLGYRGYLTFEYFHPWQHYPEALIYQTSDSMDRLLGRKTSRV
ncbi:MAG TPA: sugar phosphate isomerase/epimerase family protein [Pirellulales bacterium]|jgi:hexulose-6-phosphate isomerase